jgi:hypothetical protein
MEVGVLPLVMSVAVLLAGVWLAVYADGPSDTRLFGVVLLVIGLLGLITAVMMRRRRG